MKFDTLGLWLKKEIWSYLKSFPPLATVAMYYVNDFPWQPANINILNKV